MQKSASGTRVSRRRLTRVNPLFGMQKTHLASDTPREPDALLCIWHAGESSTTHPRGRCRKVHLGASGPTPPVQVSQMRFSASGTRVSRRRLTRVPDAEKRIWLPGADEENPAALVFGCLLSLFACTTNQNQNQCQNKTTNKSQKNIG
jgi:hypothetical protein